MNRFPPVADLVPHAPPTLALDELLRWEPGRAWLSLAVRSETLLVHGGQLASVAVLEFLAQGVAACLGYEAFRTGGGVRVGMVVAVRRMVVHRASVAVGERLELEVAAVRTSDQVSTFQTVARDAQGAPVVTAAMTLLHAERPPD
jgi:predicted hotdog family 3-hydroxylacyl-ACP dehydratase